VSFALASLLSKESRADDPELTWDISGRAGYGFVYTDSVSYLHAGCGGSMGHLFFRHLRLELTGLASTGQTISAGNATMLYTSSSTSFQGTFGIGYQGSIGPIYVRPALRSGLSIITTKDQVGASIIRNQRLEPIVGPSLGVVARVKHLELGVVTEAFFLPGWIASPTFGVYGVVGVAL
jgi:hypothetical protein